MEERKRFQSQTLDSKDYKKTETEVKLIKGAGIVISVFSAKIALTKWGPRVLKEINKFFKP